MAVPSSTSETLPAKSLRPGEPETIYETGSAPLKIVQPQHLEDGHEGTANAAGVDTDVPATSHPAISSPALPQVSSEADASPAGASHAGASEASGSPAGLPAGDEQLANDTESPRDEEPKEGGEAEEVNADSEEGVQEEMHGNAERTDLEEVPEETEDEEGKVMHDEAAGEDGEEVVGEDSELPGLTGTGTGTQTGTGTERETGTYTPVSARSVEDAALPLNRVKRIMKVDPDIKKVSMEAFRLVSSATELFLGVMAEAAMSSATNRKRKNIRGTDVVQGVRENKRLRDFLGSALESNEGDEDDDEVGPTSQAPIRKSKPKKKVTEAPRRSRLITGFFSKF